MDREKVIKDNAIRGLQSAIEISGAMVHLRKEHAKAILALLKEKEEKMEHLNNITLEYEKEVFRLQTLLKEQEAVEPYSMNAERTYGICPKCGKIVFRYGNVEENHYCGVCGQAVKWE